jgi:hypothetical protein
VFKWKSDHQQPHGCRSLERIHLAENVDPGQGRSLGPKRKLEQALNVGKPGTRETMEVRGKTDSIITARRKRKERFLKVKKS